MNRLKIGRVFNLKIIGVILAMLSLIFTGCGSLIVKDINSQPIGGVKFSTDSKYEVSKEDSNIPGMSPTKTTPSRIGLFL